jgi:hypothetical protein
LRTLLFPTNPQTFPRQSPSTGDFEPACRYAALYLRRQSFCSRYISTFFLHHKLRLPQIFTTLHVRSVIFDFYLAAVWLLSHKQYTFNPSYSWVPFSRIANIEGEGRYLKRKRVSAVRGDRGSLLPTGSLITDFSRPKGMQDVPKEEDPVWWEYALRILYSTQTRLHRLAHTAETRHSKRVMVRL